MDEKPYYSIIVEELVWDTMTEPVEPMPYIESGIRQHCPGNYDIVFNPQHCEEDCLVNCGSIGLYLLFNNKYERTAWVLKWA